MFTQLAAACVGKIVISEYKELFYFRISATFKDWIKS